jgi:hypothetical protein
MKPVFLLLCSALSLASCRSSPAKRDTPENRETARLGAVEPLAQTGGYYRLKSGMNGFYFKVPNYTDMLPSRFLLRGHIVQLLDASVGDGWARVKNEDLQIGYVKFESIKIVPPEKQPQPKERGMDEELDQNMNLE